ncbi:hypothetical protein KEM54_002010 [Ascosphaera aggregata]|nr:hypothetical protein KEM54_002010 [Ascosphaera aggregata]
MSSPPSGKKRPAPPTVDLTGSSDDEVQCLGSAPASTNMKQESSESSTETVDRQPVLNLLGLDRKKMEEERLARLAKRRAPGDCEQPPAKRLAQEPSRPASSLNKDSMEKGRPAIEVPGLLFPNGAVKRTWAKGRERCGDDITISEVFQQDYDLQLAVMSSFQWDMDWLFSKFDLKMRTRYLLVMGAKDEETRAALLDDTKNVSALRLIFPPMGPQVNCMHSKLMLLFHEAYVRLVVPSANLVPHDWGDTGSMENVVFLIDLPKKTSETSTKTDFFDDLSFFMRAQNFPEQIIAKLELFDFSATSKLAFVHTM